ncbi:hypothetical protein GCM10022255_106880 [Dactylosporangium darangshiense]|uniref:Uncharacterized protein n=1 Tax=Dactylosporangium darangshiense TaxID=579108 RepID=A0ABP8DTK3_9ACTN
MTAGCRTSPSNAAVAGVRASIPQRSTRHAYRTVRDDAATARDDAATAGDGVDRVGRASGNAIRTAVASLPRAIAALVRPDCVGRAGYRVHAGRGRRPVGVSGQLGVKSWLLPGVFLHCH